jgi:molybdopterin converting factor small subunit
MSVRVNIFYPHLKQFTDNQDIVEVKGGTVGECISQLVEQFPGIEKGIFDKPGQLLNFIYFLINGVGVYPADLSKPVKDGDELTIVLLLAGG